MSSRRNQLVQGEEGPDIQVRLSVNRNICYYLRSTILKGHNLIGANSVLAERAYIKNCVIGKNCRIGSGVILEECYVWDNTEIKSGANVKAGIIGNNVRIDEKATLLGGCLIGENVSYSYQGNDLHRR